MKLTQQNILDTLDRNAEKIHAFGVTRLGLFGSYLAGQPRPDSDIDLLVSFQKPTFDAYMDLKFFLEDLFGKSVDLVIEENIKPALAKVKETARYAKAV